MPHGVRESFAGEDGGPPLILQLEDPKLDAIAWLREHKGWLLDQQARHGSLVFRGFNVTTAARFEEFGEALCSSLYKEYGDLPPQKDSAKVYGATPYPPNMRIYFHNEASHTPRWPLRQLFCCILPAQQGGESTFVDGREVLAALDPSLVEEFERKKLTYVRHFIPGLDVSWQAFFRTDDKAALEKACAAEGISLEWKPNDVLCARRDALAIAKHPVTGERLWFNQIGLHHPWFLDAATRDALREMFGEMFPRNVTFGDGTPIPDDAIAQIDQVLNQLARTLRLEHGEVMFNDNMLVAHARETYVGDRKILVVLGDPITENELTP